MAKAEIGWVRHDPDGTKMDVYAHHFGGDWLFYEREKRYDQWQEISRPLLEDWQALLDAVERKIQRRQLRPEESGRVRKKIREEYPDAKV